ncbi:MAG: hypothetical protein U0835_08630 [Isosphaeraceae bacterium]
MALHDAWPRPRRAYTEAMHRLPLEQIIDLASTKQGKTPIAAIKAVEARRPRKEAGPGADAAEGNPVHKSPNHLKEMRKTVQALKVDSPKDAQISQYGGTTVRDLAEFMRDHHLGFAPCNPGREPQRLPELCEAVRIQLEMKAVLLDAGTEGKVGEAGKASKSDRRRPGAISRARGRSRELLREATPPRPSRSRPTRPSPRGWSAFRAAATRSHAEAARGTRGGRGTPAVAELAHSRPILRRPGSDPPPDRVETKPVEGSRPRLLRHRQIPQPRGAHPSPGRHDHPGRVHHAQGAARRPDAGPGTSTRRPGPAPASAADEKRAGL